MDRVKTIKLRSVADYSDDRISFTKLSPDNYIGTDNLLQNKLGKANALYTPKIGITAGYGEGDILIGNIRPYLKKIWYATNNGGSSADVLTLKVKKDSDSKFVYYSLFRDDFFYHMMKGSKGTKMPRGDKTQVLDFLIPSFPITVQQKIASVLSSLDSKIELNNKINSELELMAKTLYNYWFVQFDFPNKNGKPYKTNKGKMVWSEDLKKEIPEGWECLFLNDYLEFERGMEPGATNYFDLKETENHIPFYKVGGMDGESKTWILKEIAGSSLAVEDDIFVSFDGTVGKLVIGISGAYSTGIRKIYQKKGYFPKAYVYFVFDSEEIQKTIKKYATGSNILHAGSSIDVLAVPYNKEVIVAFNSKVENIFLKLLQIKKENRELSELRDWLLPMLMNGQITIK